MLNTACIQSMTGKEKFKKFKLILMNKGQALLPGRLMVI